MQTFYRWRKEYGGLKMDQAKRLKNLEKENGKLKQLVAELSLDKQILKGYCSGKLLSPERRRSAVEHAHEEYEVSERLACRVVTLIATARGTPDFCMFLAALRRRSWNKWL